MSPARAAPSVGQAIRDRRMEKELGLRELARLIDIAPSYLSDIENDRRVPASSVMEAIAKELGLSYDALMALAGRLDEQTENYLKRQPQAAVLFRKISSNRLGEHDLQKLTDQADQMGKRPRS